MLYLFFIKNSNRNVIVGASTLTAGNIKKGVKIFNVTGTFTGWVDNSIVMFQNGTLVQNSNLGGTVTYSAGTWWERASIWATTWSGGTWSQSTNIILKLTPDSNGWTLSDHWQCARMQFGPINTPTFKSVSISFAYVSSQNNIKVPYLAWGSENSLNQYSPVKRSNTYGRYSLYSGGVGKSSSGQKTVSHNIYNYTVNGDTTWYQWFDIKLYCELPYDATSNVVTVNITKITLNKSTV